MVLAQLGGSIARALARMKDATVVDEKVLADCLNEISRALLQADVRFETVRDVKANIKTIVNLDALAAGTDKRRIIQKNAGSREAGLHPSKGKPSVVMFVGLQGSGKTTTCTKYADYYRRKGFNPALVCADTFRAGAFDQLKQNASKAKIPFYGSYIESDPVKIAVEGVDRFRKEKCDLIIVDTSGRHKQEAALFEEMRQVSEATKPNLVIFVMDGSIGQAAFDQAQAFKQSASVGAVIVTKMDGHAKGGGALSAVAATRSPVIFIGTGEHIPDFEVFDVKPFVSRLLGMGDLSGLMDKIQDVMPADELVPKLTEGAFTLRLLYEMFQNLQNMGPLGQLFSMIPGLSSQFIEKGKEKEGQAKIKRYMTIMDSMTQKELDNTNPKLMNESRINRIARGSGRLVKEVVDMLEEHKRIAKMWSKLPINNIRRPNNRDSLKPLVNALPPNMLNQLGGLNGLQNMMKQMGSQKR
ncbi:signal recognition particle 54 kDa protein 2-like [Panicum miliaceum]|uniref:Signal recognition particle 54 kDa protein n=1 Tax=Panicum miliaceum TaxID=4540 RepID=A0A3L6R3U9_PANMI|nr:signal recognition particle 54 kDa protein 2-like [Panicum miliaceum]